MVQPVNLSNRQRTEEILKCGADPSYFIKNYVKIQHPARGLVPFETFPFQDDCLHSFNQFRFNIVLKSRQLGLSTIAAAYCAWLALFYRDKNVLAIATKLSTAMNFTKKVKTMVDSVPDWMKICKYTTTKQSITFSNGSVVTAVPTSEDAGRSEALSVLIVDEAAFIRGFDELWLGLYPTLSTGGSAILLSTPNGVGGQYYKLWVDAEAGLNNFNPIKLPWYVHPERDQSWFDRETRNMSKRAIAQELLCSFESSGDTFLQTETLEWVHANVTDPVSKEGNLARNMWIWDNPQHGKKYVISADVARGNSNDYSAFHVIDYDELEVVAEYMDKIPPDKFGDLLCQVGAFYNDALIAPENNTYGYATCMRIKELKYPHLYYEKCRGDPWAYVPTDDDIPGFSTQTNIRSKMLIHLEQQLRNKHLKIYSQRTFEQFRGFVWVGNKPKAQADCHDDLIMSLAIGTWLCADEAQDVDTNAEEMAKAMLRATGVTRRDVATTFADVNSSLPTRMQILSSGGSPYKAVPMGGIRGFENFDPRWLLK
jgi:hypothetical protein